MPIQKVPACLQGIPSLLLTWYSRYKRQMPWRDCGNSYYIWLSEIMLQQTRVEAVRAYFLRFVAELPTIEALAGCGEEKLLKLWEGLGYYNRVRNLQKAAQMVMEQYHGELPRDYRELLRLPGIGEYTAGAIASIAYGIAVPCVDGNVMRVLSRITADPADIAQPAAKRHYQALVQAWLDGLASSAGQAENAAVGNFNQALMELGATVCLPNGAPQCAICPVAQRCLAHQQGREEAFPIKAAKALRRQEKKTICVMLYGDLVLLQKRPDSGLLAGLWEFPHLDGWASRSSVQSWLASFGAEAEGLYTLKKAKHVFSHIEWLMQGYLIYLTCKAPLPGRWIALSDLRQNYALPNAIQAYSRELERWIRP